ncbi:hypothetical protein AQUSIP_23140 [Aquicella siphonis]|uniref:Uncharacterized protein n=1 Tax=Aquicella siphonis TaxID=254247 RepID=A0A5E4PKQ3_9COXI|nr:hypothetical protein [Aquicella siphonis]VVC76987.1 hypothetical protein AQUSIP_23140 [Aquicella siphonis]
MTTGRLLTRLLAKPGERYLMKQKPVQFINNTHPVPMENSHDLGKSIPQISLQNAESALTASERAQLEKLDETGVTETLHDLRNLRG